MENRKSNEIKMTNFLDLFYLLSIMFSSFALFIKIVKMALYAWLDVLEFYSSCTQKQQIMFVTFLMQL
jgi:hypothetical protein